MAIQKNFVIKNGLEVDNNLIFADSGTKKVGIGTAIANYDLHVRSSIGSTTLDVTGIATIHNLVSTAATFANIDIGNVLTPIVGFNTITADVVDTNILDLSDGSIRISGSTGSDGQYLVSTGTGVEWSQLSSSRTVTFIDASPGQLDLTGLTYQVGSLDVFINGVKLSSSEFVATDGQNITLSAPCFGGEIIEVVSYRINTISSGDVSVSGIVTATQGFISVGNTSPVKIEVNGNQLVFNVVGIGSTTLTLF